MVMISKNFIILFVGTIIFYGLFTTLSDYNLVASILQEIKIELIPLILLLVTFSIFVKAIRQFYLLKFCRIDIPFRDNFLIFFGGLSLIFTPLGIGEAIKTKFLKDGYNIPIGKSLPIVIIEKYHEVLGITSLIAFTLLVYDSIEIKLVLLLGIIISIIIFFIFHNKTVTIFFKKISQRFNFLKKIIQHPEESQQTLVSLTKPKPMIISWLFTIFSMLIELISVLLIFYSLNFTAMDFILVSQLMLTSLFLGNISFLPGGIGITDASLIGLLTSKGVEISLATSITLMVRLIGTWYKSLIGFIAMKFLIRD